jgi:glycosyltransferase involved in cell wall biosynthesis
VSPKRIGYYMSSPMLGGAETLLRHLIARADRDVFEVSLFAPPWDAFDDYLELSSMPDVTRVDTNAIEMFRRTGPATEPPKSETPSTAERFQRSPLGLTLRRGILGASRYATWSSNLRRLQQTTTEHPLDLLHIVNGGYPGAPSAQQVARAARKAGVPSVIMTIASTPRFPTPVRMIERRIDRSIVSAVDIFTVASPAIAQTLTERRSVPARQIRSIPFGVEPAVTPPSVTDRASARASMALSPDRRVIGMISRMTQEKGFDVLIDSVSRIPYELDAIAVLAGDGPFRSALEAQVRARGLENRVHFTGRLEHPGVLYLAADVVTLPSDIEGLPLVVLEAMAAGRPVVATSVGGIPTAVDDGVTGFLVPPRDPEALARRLSELLADPARADRMGQAGRDRFLAEFTLDRMVERFASLYRELLDR